MAKSDDNDLSDKCMAIVSEAYARAITKNPRKIHPAYIAAIAYSKMDKTKRAPTLVKYAARLQLRQMATTLCRKVHEKVEATLESAQQEIWDLQANYPVTRSGELIFIARMDMTLEDRQANISRLRKESAAKARHADALQAETDKLVAQGYFEKQTEPA